MSSAVVVIIVLAGVLVVVGLAVRVRQLRRALDVLQSDLRRALAKLQDQDDAAVIMQRALNRPPVPAVVPKPMLTLIQDGRDLVKDHPKTVAMTAPLAALLIALATGSSTALEPTSPNVALPAPSSIAPTTAPIPTVPIPGPVAPVEPQTLTPNGVLPVSLPIRQRTAERPVRVQPTSAAPSPAAPVGGGQEKQPPPVTSDPPTSGPSPTPTPTPSPPTPAPGPQPLCLSALGILDACVQL